MTQSLVESIQSAKSVVDALLADATDQVRRRLAEGGMSGELFDREQRATHGLAWFATYAEAVRQLVAYAERMAAQGLVGEVEEHLVRIGIGEYIAQMVGGIPMSQNEFVRPTDLGLTPAQVAGRITPED